MMDATFLVDIITPEKTIFSDLVVSLHVPGESGSFTILSQHAPIVAALKEGEIRITNKFSKEYSFSCQSGILECANDKVSILLEK